MSRSGRLIGDPFRPSTKSASNNRRLHSVTFITLVLFSQSCLQRNYQNFIISFEVSVCDHMAGRLQAHISTRALAYIATEMNCVYHSQWEENALRSERKAIDQSMGLRNTTLFPPKYRPKFACCYPRCSVDRNSPNEKLVSNCIPICKLQGSAPARVRVCAIPIQIIRAMLSLRAPKF